MTVGQKIRALREERGMTQRELGEKLNMTASAVGKFEGSTKTPKVETLEKFAAAFQVPLLSLIEDAQWVSVNIGLPDAGDKTWVYAYNPELDDYVVDVDSFCADRGESGQWHDGPRFTKSGWFTYTAWTISHWMPLEKPKPPQSRSLSLKYLRLKAGISQKEIAKRLGVTQSTVSMWEAGINDPSIRTLGVLAKEYGVSVNDVYTAIVDTDIRDKFYNNKRN